MKDPNNPCLFCNIKESGCAHENNLAYASYDSYPVSDFHCLIIPKRHIKDYFELSKDELIACDELIKTVKDEIIFKDKSVKGFNLGTNIGKTSGQDLIEKVKHYPTTVILSLKNLRECPRSLVKILLKRTKELSCIWQKSLK